MSIYKVNNNPTIEKIRTYDSDDDTYYRFQNKDWEMGTKSWGMIYSTEEEAIESCEDFGYTPETAILNGKSCCCTADELWGYAQNYDKDFVVLVLEGAYVEEGHDGESVVDVTDIKEIWDREEFLQLMLDTYKEEEEEENRKLTLWDRLRME